MPWITTLLGRNKLVADVTAHASRFSTAPSKPTRPVEAGAGASTDASGRWVRRKRILYAILGIYVALSVMWFLIDMADGTESIWFYWPTLGTCIDVAIAAIALLGDGLEAAARDDVAKKRYRSAGQKLVRTTNYLVNAERMQAAHSPERRATYQRCLDMMEQAFELVDPATTRVAVPYGDTTLPAYFTKAPGEGPTPCMIMWNGLDSTKEHMYTSFFQEELAGRGISTLMVDCPGSGEALRMQDLTARGGPPRPAAAARRPGTGRACPQ